MCYNLPHSNGESLSLQRINEDAERLPDIVEPGAPQQVSQILSDSGISNRPDRHHGALASHDGPAHERRSIGYYLVGGHRKIAFDPVDRSGSAGKKGLFESLRRTPTIAFCAINRSSIAGEREPSLVAAHIFKRTYTDQAYRCIVSDSQQGLS